MARAKATVHGRKRKVSITPDSDLLAALVARVVGAQTRVLSPIEGIPEEDAEAGGDYFTLMRQNLANLREGMRCS